MIPNIPNNFTNIDLGLYNNFNRYRISIFSQIDKWWKEEDLFEKACTQFTLGAFFLAQHYITLIYLDIQRGYFTLDQLESKYDITNMRKNFACKGINIDYIFNDFGFNITPKYGIENLDIEQYFIIEPSELLPVNNNSNLLQYLTQLETCSSTLESC